MSESTPDNWHERLHEGIEPLLASLAIDAHSPVSIDVQQAISLARVLQHRANQLQTPQERRQQAELDRMIHNPRDKATLMQLTDQAFRSSAAQRSADQLVHILDLQGIPRFFSTIDRTLLKGFQSFGSYLPGVAVPLVKERMHRETANVILPAEEELLQPHLAERREAGLRMNVNFLGEAILGEAEAERRLEAYLAALQRPEIEVLSVKISTIFSQISPLAREHTINTLVDRLERLYRAAASATFVRADGLTTPKFIYLDMEEYRDMPLTADAFMRTLDRDGLADARAGIALQAYIPDSAVTQRRINQWARQRVAAGGAPVVIRLVKGANLEMERVEASIHGWPQAPFKTKRETDANFKRMLVEGLRHENIAAVRIAVASHNLFDVAYAMVLAVKEQVFDQIQFEMLEGMANHQRRALFELTRRMLLYAPAAKKEEFVHAIGYLIRRLDENTGPDNFLRHAFMLQVDSPEWNRLEEQFVDSVRAIDSLSNKPRRHQDRNIPPSLPNYDATHDGPFENEPDTDFSLPQNAKWAESIVERWIDKCDWQATELPLVVAGIEQTGNEQTGDRTMQDCRDPSRPGTVAARCRLATQSDVQAVVACARADSDEWRGRSPQDRSATLSQVAQELRTGRGELMGAALAEAGKLLTESDAEVSEAVDFVEFYRRSALEFYQLDSLNAQGRGVVVVVSPWNFPIAIPCGGIAAALAAGNTVILKPASAAVLCAYELCKCFWRAGISNKTLQLLPCSGSTVGQSLVAHPDVDTVILTGGTETALAMLDHKCETHLLAETGGKDATIVTALADRDQAIKNVLHSAFSHSGQKCSATSLLILEEEVYDDPKFKAALCDATESLTVGSAWNLATKVGPLIRPPSGALDRALHQLEPGESWAVKPRRSERNPQLYSPAIKWDVQPDSFTHLTELFGPVLGVMKAKNLSEAIALVNQTGYGLTAGLESLDDREQELWQQGIRAGNLYINRPTTGAIVLRQPFGGMGKSAIGPGIKAGGPNYVAQLMEFSPAGEPAGSDDLADDSLAQFRHQLRELILEANGDWPEEELAWVIGAIGSYDKHVLEEFGCQHDHFRVIGQDNLRRYLPVPMLRIRVHADDTLFEIFSRACAAKALGCRSTISFPQEFQSPTVDLLEQLTLDWAGAIEFVEESDVQLADIIHRRQTDRIRYAAADRVPDVVRRAAAATGFTIVDAPVLAEGRVELLWYIQEQSLSYNYHRYGNLGLRSDEPRQEPL